MYDLVIHGGLIVSPQGKITADIAVNAGKIVAIGHDIPVEDTQKTIDVSGMYVFPGCIDSHMHLWETGFIANNDFADGTRSSAAQGVTTVIDHPLTIPEVLDEKVFSEKVQVGEETSYTDFALHGGVGLDNLDKLEGMWKAGCTSFKIFMCESGSKVAGLDSGKLLDAFRLIGSLGGTVILHCENDEMLKHNERKLKAAGRKDYMAFVEWRPPIAETEAISRALLLLEGTNARAVFLHTTVPEGIELITAEKRKGRDLWVETCAHNLYLTTDDLAEKGPWVTYSPPVRDPERVNALWDCLREGKIHTVGSDHGTVDPVSKKRGETDIWDHLFGIPDGETLVPLMVNAVANGWISAEKMSEVLAANPAKIYGLYPRKGIIAVGSDADFTIVDMKQKCILSAKDMYTACKWIPYEGKEVSGKVILTILRGQIISENGQVVGNSGYGKFYRRES